MSSGREPIRVAIVGGGCAALTTAFELTKPEHQGRYEVTVYQMGWRLGGKGASGRGPHHRVEEHGLHLWMGFYENAFRLMRQAYEERNLALPHCRFASWRDAFKPAPDVGVADRAAGGWDFWMAHFPPGAGEPGDPTSGNPFTVTAYLRQSIILIGELLRSAGASDPKPQSSEGGAANASGAEGLAAAVAALLRYGQLATTTAILEGADLLRQAAEMFVPQFFSTVTSPLTQLIDALSVASRQQLAMLVEGNRDLRRVWQVIDLILAILRGSIRFGLAVDPRGFDAINDYDWREWLRMNGASEQSLDSGFMRGIYDLVFAFEEGDVTRPRLAAGVAMRGAMRMFFTYRGSLFYRMSAGMGDVVFAPLYQVLKQRGVQFKFFHRLRNVGLSAAQPGEAPYVQTLQFDIQARVKGGAEYQPLVDVHGVPSWPSQPDYTQLANGAALKRDGRSFEAAWEERHVGSQTLAVSKDFDLVVLGISIGALPSVARELIEHDPRWREMTRQVTTVATQCFQLWLKESTAELGWPHPPANVSGFVEPFDTWADMSHLVPEESWKEPVRSIAYFCSALPDAPGKGAEPTDAYHREQRQVVRENAIRFLDTDAGSLWPGSVRGGTFRWDLLATGDGGKALKGEQRFDTQHWAANLNPTDRYVQSLPGSVAHRISPLDMSFDNLTIAGDWTASGLDSGCIESAVMSGLLAAHALCGRPALSDIIGYDHP
ncbi:MAG TPA: NAD(P)-binding protein [Terracidiphilus sp.]